MTVLQRRLLVTLAVVALVALRKSDSLLNPQFWAEDGALFFVEAERYGGWGLLFRPYEGYLHLLPRLIAALGVSVPLLHIPAFYAWSALAITGWIAWWLQSPRIALPGGWIAALALALIPHNGEIYLTTCNLQWVTALGLFALTITDDAIAPSARLGEVALLIFTALTGPFVILALPLFAWRAWSRRSVWSYLLLVLALACTAAHAPAILAWAIPSDTPVWAPLHHAAIIGSRTFTTLFIGHHSLGELPSLTLALVVPPFLAWLLWTRRAVLPGGLALLLAALLVLAGTGYKVRPDTWTLSELINGDRYFFIPKIILAWLLGACALTSEPRFRRLYFIVLLLPLAANARRFFIPPSPDQNWRASCALIARGEPVWLPILPEGMGVFHPGRRPH